MTGIGACATRTECQTSILGDRRQNVLIVSGACYAFVIERFEAKAGPEARNTLQNAPKMRCALSGTSGKSRRYERAA